MTSIKVQNVQKITTLNGGNAIPLVNVTVKYNNLLKLHPDILFEIPSNLNIFMKLLITVTRVRYPGAGLNLAKNNSFSLGLHNLDDDSELFMEALFNLESIIYYDFKLSKCFIAFCTQNVSEPDLFYIARNIKRITRRNVYLNLPGRKYVHFDRLVARYNPHKINFNFNSDDRKKYQNNSYIDNIHELVHLIMNPKIIVNNVNDIMNI